MKPTMNVGQPYAVLPSVGGWVKLSVWDSTVDICYPWCHLRLAGWFIYPRRLTTLVTHSGGGGLLRL